MAEDDWYGPFRRGRWKGYLHFLGGASVVALALLGFTFEKQVVVDGFANPPTRWGHQIQWPPLVLGLLLMLFGVYKARRGDTR
jgi:hypothetical protein